MNLYGDFYSPVPIKSYGRFAMFSQGSRSIGKSTGWAISLLSDYVNNGYQWIYTRRTADETQLTAPTYFDNAINIMLDNGIKIEDYKYNGGRYYVNGKIAGYAVPLSLQQKYKSADFSGVHNILYDEFMIMPGSSARYLGGQTNPLAEVDAMASLYQTVDRGRGKAARNETQLIFIGNAGSFYNPFYIAYGIDRYLRPDTKYLAPKNDFYVVEMTDEIEATRHIKESNGYKLSTERTRAYAYENKFADTLSGECFIIPKAKGRREPLLNIWYEGQCYGLYMYESEGYLYLSHEPALGRLEYALTLDDHRPNYIMIAQERNHPTFRMIREMYDKGCLRFQDFKCKMVIDFFLKYQ